MMVEGDTFESEYDDEKEYFVIKNPNASEMNVLEEFEITASMPSHLNTIICRMNAKCGPGNIPLSEWQKRLVILPMEVIEKTLKVTTQYYANVEVENRSDPRRHYNSRLPGLHVNRLN